VPQPEGGGYVVGVVIPEMVEVLLPEELEVPDAKPQK
jgi:hypothetical protein